MGRGWEGEREGLRPDDGGWEDQKVDSLLVLHILTVCELQHGERAVHRFHAGCICQVSHPAVCTDK